MSKSTVKPRLNAFQNQAGTCYYCGSPMWLKEIEPFAIKHALSLSAAARFQCTAEHLIARCDGGSDDKRNIVAACLFCNINRHRRKNPPPPPHYKALIQRRLKQGKWHPKQLHLVSLPV